MVPHISSTLALALILQQLQAPVEQYARHTQPKSRRVLCISHVACKSSPQFHARTASEPMVKCTMLSSCGSAGVPAAILCPVSVLVQVGHLLQCCHHPMYRGNLCDPGFKLLATVRGSSLLRCKYGCLWLRSPRQHHNLFD